MFYGDGRGVVDPRTTPLSKHKDVFEIGKSNGGLICLIMSAHDQT